MITTNVVLGRAARSALGRSARYEKPKPEVPFSPVSQAKRAAYGCLIDLKMLSNMSHTVVPVGIYFDVGIKEIIRIKNVF